MSKRTPENAVKVEIKQWLKLHGWFVRHCLAGLGSYPGMPDLLATKDGVTIEIECKAPGGKLSENQRQYRDDLRAHGGIYIEAYGYEDIQKTLEDMA